MTFNAWFLENKEIVDDPGISVEGLKDAWTDLEEDGLSDERIYEVFSKILNAILNV